MGSRALADSYLLPALDKREDEGSGVNWKCVTKLINFVNASKCITPDLHYSLKSRLKCREIQRILNTLTVYHTIGLNGVDEVRSQLAEKKSLHVFEKVFLSNKDVIVRRAILQLLVDWSFLFGDEALGIKTTSILRELVMKYNLTIRPSALAAEVYEEHGSNLPRSTFIKGFEFENRDDQINTSKEKSSKKVAMTCAANLSSGSLKLKSVRNIFARCSARSIKSLDSPSVRSLPSRDFSEDTIRVDDMLTTAPRDCKNLQDLLQDIQVLMKRGYFDDVQSKMAVAEQLRNKCATINNTLQETITIKMKKVTAERRNSMDKEIVEPALLKKLLLTGEALNSVLAEFEQIHKTYVKQLDRMMTMTKQNTNPLFCNDGDSERSLKSPAADSAKEASKWVDFASSRNLHVQLGPPPSISVDSETPLNSDLVRTSSSSLPCSSRQSPFSRPNSSMGNRAAQTKMPILSTPAAGERGPPPLPTQSPFADASALLQATRVKPIVQRSATEVLRSTEGKPKAQNLFPSRSSSNTLLALESSSRSFSDIVNNGRQGSGSRRLPTCPALKVRFTDEHLEDVLSRINYLL